ncbi:MAG: phosphate ABC transporter permease subunit PstC [Egibacteraceae bacterium]
MTSLQSKGRGRRGDPAFRALVTAAGCTVLLVLGLMIVSTTADSWPVFAKEGLRFFTSTTWDPGTSQTAITGEYGALAFIWGTLYSSLIAIVIAVPLSVGISLYLTEVAPKAVRRPLTYTVELLAAVPSIVYALWGLLFFVPVVLRPVTSFLEGRLGFIPIFRGSGFGGSFFYAGVVLAIMILPIITAIVREVFTAVPDDERNAALALGATRWEMMRGVVIPRSRPGIVGGTMLGLGRALGETIAAALLIGSAVRVNVGLFEGGYSMAAVIANTFAESTPEGVKALIALGVALFVITIVVNVLARLVVRRMGDVTGEAAV